MRTVPLNNVIFDDAFPYTTPSHEDLASILYVTEWGDDGIIETYEDLVEWFSNWDQSESDDKYECLDDYLIDCLYSGCAMHKVKEII